MNGALYPWSKPDLVPEVIQLHHIRSGNFLTVIKMGAAVEPGALATEMVPFGTRLSQFVAQPGYATTKVGERIHHGMAIKLEAWEQRNAFLQTVA